MVCGNLAQIPQSIFDSGYPLPALIANNYGEMMSIPMYDSALMFAALLLFVIIFLFNTISRVILYRIEKRNT
jgi:phosphate transport system permease protein